MNLLNEPSTGEARPRLPVLFHLLDVSRQRPSRPPAEPSLASLSEMAEPAAATAVAPPAADLSLATPAVPIETPTISIPPAAPEAAASKSSEPAKSSPPTPRSEAERRRKAKRPTTEEWFAAHGKYIALVFVLALGATIYFARVNRRPPAVEEPPDMALNIEPGDSARSTANSKPSTTLVGDSVPNPATSTGSPAKLIETASASAPQAELFPPTETQVAARNPSAAARPAASDLFPDKKSDSRVAVQDRGQDAVANSSPTNSASPLASAAPAAPATASAPGAAPAAATASAMEPSYPHTGFPPTGLPAASYPTTHPPVTNYPPTNIPGQAVPAPPAMPAQPPAWSHSPYQPSPYSPTQFQPPQSPTQFQPPQSPTQFQPAQRPPLGYQPVSPAPGGSFVPPGGAIPPQYQPPFNSVPGTRYERSGSGLY